MCLKKFKANLRHKPLFPDEAKYRAIANKMKHFEIENILLELSKTN